MADIPPKRSLLVMLWPVLAFMAIGCAHQPEIKDQVVVITGASSGFGKGVAHKLAAQGANIVVAARRTALLDDLAQQYGDHALAVTTDVGSEEDMERLAEAAIAKFGRIDVWINNAGVGAFGRFEDVPLADHTRLIQTNLLGAIYGSHFALRQFRKQGHGTLINIASILGKIGTPYYASYSASTFGIVGLGQALNQELRLNDAEQIHISTISPMATDTPFWEHTANYSGHSPRQSPLCEAEEVVDAIVAATTNPKKEVTVTFTGKAAVFWHRMIPDTVEIVFAENVHRQMKNAPPAARTAGSVHVPLGTGTHVNAVLNEGRAEEQGH